MAADRSGKRPRKPGRNGVSPKPRTVVPAGGGVLWRRRGDAVEVALVHRLRYDDWSLPKGKVDPGESLPATAVREIREEAGSYTRLSKLLGVVEYPLTDDTRKQVTYWSAESIGGDFAENSEVDNLVWTSVEKAAKRVSYPLDAKVLKHFRKVPAFDRVIVIVRHARAGDREKWTGDDDLRPLDKLGLAQAEALVGQCLAFGAGPRVYSADRLRCVQTVEPLAADLGVEVRIEPAFSEEAYAADSDAAWKRLAKIVQKAGGADVPVLCSQGGVIPALLERLSRKHGLEIADPSTKKAGMWVLGFDGTKPVWADYLPSPLPVR